MGSPTTSELSSGDTHYKDKSAKMETGPGQTWMARREHHYSKSRKIKLSKKCLSYFQSPKKIQLRENRLPVCIAHV